MKYFFLVCLFLFSISVLSFGQNYLEAGDACFKTGNYQCAGENYEKELKKKYNQIADIKSKRANNCLKSLTQANAYFEQKKYSEAKLAYQEVLDLNSIDYYAKQQIDKCNQYLYQVTSTLSLSKGNLSFTALGGNETISVSGNSTNYNVEQLPTWCTVKKYSTHFVITCNSNPSASSRNDYFIVKAGNKSERVNVYQVGGQNTKNKNQPTTLSVSMQYVYFEKTGGNSDPIKVYSNAKEYSISMTPSWCTIKYYAGYFTIVCEVNYSKPRSDWFYVNAGDKQVKIVVSQKGSDISNKVSIKTKSNPTNLYIGVGAIKPLIFKADGRTLSNIDVGYSFTLGFVKTLGLYAKVNTNFSSISGDYTPSALPNIYYGVTDEYSNSTFNRFSLVGGFMLKLSPVMLYVGAGKGHYYHYEKTDLYNYLDDSFVNKINLTTMSFSGLEADAGLIINFNKVGISMGVSSFSFKYYEVNAGLGIRL